jgi:hypothetical protein
MYPLRLSPSAWWPPEALLEGAIHALGALTCGGRFAAAVVFSAPVWGADKRYIEEEGGQGP